MLTSKGPSFYKLFEQAQEQRFRATMEERKFLRTLSKEERREAQHFMRKLVRAKTARRLELWAGVQS